MSALGSTRTPQTLTASFRAKSAGVSLVTTFALGAYYFANAAGLGAPFGDPTAPMPNGAAALGGLTLLLFVIVQMVLQTVLAIGVGRVEAHAAADREAAAFGRRIAHPVYVAGGLFLFGAAFAGASTFCLANVALGGVLVGEMARFAGELAAYRRRG